MKTGQAGNIRHAEAECRSIKEEAKDFIFCAGVCVCVRLCVGGLSTNLFLNALFSYSQQKAIH